MCELCSEAQKILIRLTDHSTMKEYFKNSGEYNDTLVTKLGADFV
jgi:hypothetical protein